MLKNLWLITCMSMTCMASERDNNRLVSFQHYPYGRQDLSVMQRFDLACIQHDGIIYHAGSELLSLRQKVKNGSAQAVEKIHSACCNLKTPCLGFVNIERSALENLISNTSTSCLKIEDRAFLIRTIILSLSKAQRHEILNRHDLQGQTIAHKLTPIHWYVQVVHFLIDQGLDVTVPTIAPDKYVGSTLAHNVAALLLPSNACGQLCLPENTIRVRRKRAFDCLVTLWCVDHGKHFEYVSGGLRPMKVWDLMPVEMRDEFKNNLPASEQVAREVSE